MDVKQTLYQHIRHPHTAKNVNQQHREEQSLNTRIAVLLTRIVGTMSTAYIFALIGIGSLIGVFTGNVFWALLFGSISSYFLQLVLLPVLAVGTQVLSRHAELMAEEQFNTTMKTEHTIEQIVLHLEKQDEELLKQTELLVQLLQQVELRKSRKKSPIPPL